MNDKIKIKNTVRVFGVALKFLAFLFSISFLLDSVLYAQNNDNFLDDVGESGAFGSRSDGQNADTRTVTDGENENEDFGEDDLGFGDNNNEFGDEPEQSEQLNNGEYDQKSGNQNLNNQDLNDQGLNNQGLNNQGLNNQGLNNQGLNNQGLNNQGLGTQSLRNNGLDQMSQMNSPGSPASPMNGMNGIDGEEASVLPTNLLDNYEINAAKIEEANEFSGTPPIPGSLRIMADGEAPEEYYIESGDTLFDICSQLLDEGGYWPKLWSLNPQIKNPHFVWPGMRLSFYPGDEETPPFLEVVSEEDIVPIDKGELVEEVLLHGMIPDLDQAFKMTGTEVIGREDVEISEEVDGRIMEAGKIFDPTTRKFTVPGFIFEEQKESLAVIMGGLEGEAMVGEDKLALAKITESLSPGTIYSILRPVKEVENERTGDTVGFHYDFIANIKVDSLISESEVAIVRVISNRLGVEKGDLIVSFASTTRSIPITKDIGSVSSSEGNIVAFGSSGRYAGAQGSLLFIDKGSSDGVSLGQYFQIFSRPGYLTNGDIQDTLENVRLPVGYIKIVDLTEVAALGFVVKNSKEIRLGDSLSKG